MVSSVMPIERIEKKILLLRGEKVMLDSDLAELYKVTTFNLNKAVKRNLDRFPEDFMFQLREEEFKALRFQIGMSKPSGRGGRRHALQRTQEQTSGSGQYRNYAGLRAAAGDDRVQQGVGQTSRSA
ncbi:MAG: ORF6N domain-containing protein [Nitrospira sp.]|nr:ORF6N domain-containing protein [Nitrospira sp.]